MIKQEIYVGEINEIIRKDELFIDKEKYLVSYNDNKLKIFSNECPHQGGTVVIDENCFKVL